MKYHINEDTMRVTSQCERNYSCLSGHKECLCKIEKARGNVLFIHPENTNCKYRSSFAYFKICLCPIRNEIYERYRI